MNQDSDKDDQDIGALLRLAGAREELPEDLKTRWEGHVRDELTQLQVQRRSRHARRRNSVLAMCATLAALALGIGLLNPQDSSPGVAMRLVYVEGEHQVTASDGTILSVGRGDALPSGALVVTGDTAHVALNYNGYDLRLNSGSRMRLGDDVLWLLAGGLYAADRPDSPPRPGHGLHIETANGSIRDIGTQFTVTLENGRTRATVRQGSIQVSSGGEDRTLTAASGGALRATLGDGGSIAIDEVSGRGEEWSWIHRASPGFTLEGRTALDFLSWVAHESGQRLVFTSPATQRHARLTVLHGDITGLSPEQALEPVLASTDLRVNTDAEGELRVSRVDPL